MDHSTFPKVQPLLTTHNITIDWQEVSRVMLKKSLLVNPLATQPNESKLEETSVPLRAYLVETGRQAENQKYSQQEVFEIILEQPKSKTMITGNPGSGKTHLMQRIANLVLRETEDNVVIWLSLADLGKENIHHYLTHKWLKLAANTSNTHSQIWLDGFNNLLESGKVWLLLDDSQELLNNSVISDNLINSREIITPLNLIEKQLKDWTNNLKIIVASRTEIWEKEQGALLLNWQVYRISPLTYPKETKAFIEHWFKTTNSQLTSLKENPYLIDQVWQFLEELPRSEQKKWHTNPLYLALLCRYWQQSSEPSLKTIAQLYQKGVSQYYQWKAGTVSIHTQKREQLNQHLAQLALNTLQEKGTLEQVSESRFESIFQNEPQLGQLALELGWLNCIALKKIEAPQPEKVYQFFDLAVAEYFASLAIDNWQVFTQNQAQKDLRIFDVAWQKVILFWFGHNEVKTEEKEAFIEYLTEFKDQCGIDNYYGKKAYFLAAQALSEYPECNRLLLIISQLLKLAFSNNSLLTPGIIEKARLSLEQIPGTKSMKTLMNFLDTIEDSKTYRLALKSLERMSKGHPSVIAMLTDLIDSHQSDDLKEQCAESLLRLSPDHDKATITLVKIIEQTESEEVRQNALNSLERIGQGNLRAICTITRLLSQTSPTVSQKRLFQCLEKIGKYHSIAIATLVQIIRTSEDPIRQRQAAESLEKIDPGNPTAVTVLTQLMQPLYEETVRKEAIYSLGEIESGHQKVIEALIRQIKDAPEMLIRWLAISSLGKIAQGNQESIEALTEVIYSTEDSLLRKEAIDSLLKIAPNSSETVYTLIRLLEDAQDEEICREVAESLGKIDPGNPEAITALTQLLHSTSDDYTRRQVAFSLGQIDPGNLQALNTLIHLVQSHNDSDLSLLALDSLGEIAVSNSAVVATLIRAITSNPQPQIIRSAVKSLGRIRATGATSTLIELLSKIKDQSLRDQIAENLIKILRPQDLTSVVKSLPGLWQFQKAGSAVELILWYCVQNLAYPEFYQAWHQPLPENKQDPEKAPLSYSDLINSLQNSPQLVKQKVHLIWIDIDQFIEPENPALDIYDQMLDQECPEFVHGLPDSMVKLRLYWHSLERQKVNTKTPALFFYSNQDDQTNVLPTLWQTLEKFKGAIALISEQVKSPTSFSLKDSAILTSILDWLRKESN